MRNLQSELLLVLFKKVTSECFATQNAKVNGWGQGNLLPFALQNVYKIKLKDGNTSALAKRCNDFVLLEKACENYVK